MVDSFDVWRRGERRERVNGARTSCVVILGWVFKRWRRTLRDGELLLLFGVRGSLLFTRAARAVQRRGWWIAEGLRCCKVDLREGGRSVLKEGWR